MERAFGSDRMPSGVLNKSAVLTVKPLRCLAPIFPSPSDPSAPPSSQYASIPPAGPFPPGATPFFPFFAASDPQRPGQQRSYPIPSPVPLNSFKTPVSASGNGDIGTSRRSFRNPTGVDDDGNSQGDSYDNSYERNMETGNEGYDKTPGTRRKVRSRSGGTVSNNDAEVDSVVSNLLRSFSLVGIDTALQANSGKEFTDRSLIVFNLLRRKITLLEEKKEATPGLAKRPDLRAGTLCMNKGVRANTQKRIGAVPGVSIGDIFFFRMEMCIVGLHAPSMAGIDYMSFRVSGDDEPLAVSIVSSGGYEDEGDDGDVLIYSGQGGQRRDKQQVDQQLVRGNLALEKSLHKANEVRVIRGLKDFLSPTGKVYVYDGLYKIHESWIEKGKSGCNVFKYKLVRVAGQPEAFTLWKSIQQWKDGTSTRPGVILPDLTSGAESLPVCLVNDLDGEKGPAYFTYISSLKYTKPFPPTKPSVVNCNCTNGCQSNTNCPCVQRNDGYIPYTSLGVLLSHNSLVHECGNMCVCPITCKNRVSQAGLKMRLEVFKTKDRGWGLRSWDPIRSGSFICEYAGVVISENRIDSDDNYIFDATRTFEPLETQPCDEPVKFPFPLIISARHEGNVSRFMNHSCSPNVYWQPVIRENQDESYFHVGFYAIKHIPPMQELTFNYGMIPADKAGPRRRNCLCGSSNCKGFFY